MPIDDEITNYVFPVNHLLMPFSGCHILPICALETSVAEWIKGNWLGFVLEPYVAMLVDQFHEIEKTNMPIPNINKNFLIEFTLFLNTAKLEEVLKGL